MSDLTEKNKTKQKKRNVILVSWTSGHFKVRPVSQ